MKVQRKRTSNLTITIENDDDFYDLMIALNFYLIHKKENIKCNSMEEYYDSSKRRSKRIKKIRRELVKNFI